MTVTSCFRTLAAWSLAVILTVAAAHAQDAAPRKLRIAAGTSVLNITYPNLTLPLTLGYWKSEGLDVEILPVGASLQAVQQMVAGNAEFVQINAGVVLQANSKNRLPVRIVMGNGVLDWAVAVTDDGPIKSIKDLKGKTVGVFSQASGGVAYLISYLKANGIDPKEVDLVPLGLGAPPVQALRNGQVQGLLYWGAAIASFENAGLKLRKLVPEDWPTYPDYVLATMQSRALDDPKAVVGLARGMAKATVFALANPECARKLHWQTYPATKSSGGDEATVMKWDTHLLEAQLDSMRAAYALNGGQVWGNVDPRPFDRLSTFLTEAKLIDRPVPAKDVIVDASFAAQINNFDRAAVEASARECKF